MTWSATCTYLKRDDAAEIDDKLTFLATVNLSCTANVKESLFLRRVFSQGSVATQLRNGGPHNNTFVANLILNVTVKEF